MSQSEQKKHSSPIIMKVQKQVDPILEMAILWLLFHKKILLKLSYLCWMRQTISKLKDDFEIINQFILFRIIKNRTEVASFLPSKALILISLHCFLGISGRQRFSLTTSSILNLALITDADFRVAASNRSRSYWGWE